MDKIISEKLIVEPNEIAGMDSVSAFSEKPGQYDLAGLIIGCAMKVHRTLGPGFLESIYQKALLYELTKGGFRVESDKAIQVRYDGIIVGDFKADLLVNNDLIVEMKAVSTILIEHEIQLVNYLTATGKETGLLLNFGRTSLEFKKKFRTTKLENVSLH